MLVDSKDDPRGGKQRNRSKHTSQSVWRGKGRREETEVILKRYFSLTHQVRGKGLDGILQHVQHIFEMTIIY